MSDSVFSMDDIRVSEGDDKLVNATKAVLHQVKDVETALFCLKPGGAVKAHSHSDVWDLFIGVSGTGSITFIENDQLSVTAMKEWSFCAMPPNVVHEVRNLSDTDDLMFLLLHTPWEGYDFIPSKLIEAAEVKDVEKG